MTCGDYLKELIKSAGITQTKFYCEWGIKKAYFYDIVSGRTNPPPYEMQVKAMEILEVCEEKRIIFYDLAAKERGDMPADILHWVDSNPSAIKNIRKIISNEKGDKL